MRRRINIVRAKKNSRILPAALEKKLVKNLQEVDRMHDRWLLGLAQKFTPRWARILIKLFKPRWVIERYRLQVVDITARGLTERIYRRRYEVFLRGKLVARNFKKEAA